MLILSINKNILIPIVIVSVILVIILIAYFFDQKRVILRKLSKIPVKSTSHLKVNGLVKITGKALHVHEPLIAPLSHRKCIFYWVKIEQKVSSGKSSHWKTLVHEEKIQDFFLDANGDMVLIKPTQSPKNYISYLTIDKKTTSGTFNDPTPEFETLLKRYHISGKGLFGFNKKLRYKEGVITIGERITVAGLAHWKTLSEPVADYPYSKIMSLESDIKQKLIITDLPEAILSH